MRSQILFSAFCVLLAVGFGCGTDDYPYYEAQRYYGADLSYTYSTYENDWVYYATWDADIDGVPDHYDYCPYRAGSDYNYGCPYDNYYSTVGDCCSWLRRHSSRYYYYWSWYTLPENCY
jgi:hypothetical protein